jgi:hypothetical protein
VSGEPIGGRCGFAQEVADLDIDRSVEAEEEHRRAERQRVDREAQQQQERQQLRDLANERRARVAEPEPHIGVE